ncbi:hypothetical protein [Hydrogenophaga sp.]|uniref:hypothetical protein n=1 Tax=Hydrogenophaga sp. TaxID=1904254 RepID=UPI0035637EFF
MLKQRIYVSVVGFSDVERHALNTLFRLSEEREFTYVPWVPLVAPNAEPMTGMVTIAVALVDGDSVEAVLSHARELPLGQRLIWVGPDAPAHAWRVLSRPIQWAEVLSDLDAVFAARQADSGLLDLDVTSPAPLADEFGVHLSPPKRALLVSSDLEERTYLRSRLALAGIVDVDGVTSSESAAEMIGRHRYVCGVFNLDDQLLDAWSLASLFRQRNPDSLTMATSQLASPLSDWWSRKRIKRDTDRAGIRVLLAKPLQPREISQWMALL